MNPTPTDAAPAAMGVARRKHRAMAIPWARARATRRRQVSWLAGQGSDAPAFPDLSVQWPVPALPF